MSYTSEERETIVRADDAKSPVTVWTAQQKYVRRFRKAIAAGKPVVEVRTGPDDEWAEFEIPHDQWSPLTGLKRVSNLTPEQKAASAARLREARREQIETNMMLDGWPE